MLREDLRGSAPAAFRVGLPEWDGGSQLPPVRVVHTALAVRGFALGGLGGRLELEFDQRPGANLGLTLAGEPPALWVPDGPGVEVTPAAATAGEGAPAPPALTRSWRGAGHGAPPLLVTHAAGALAAHVTGGAWDPPLGRQRLSLGIEAPRPTHPWRLLLPVLTAWRRLGPIVFSLRASDGGRRFEVPLPAGEGRLEIRVEGLRGRERYGAGDPAPEFRELVWASRLRHPSGHAVLPALMSRRTSRQGGFLWAPANVVPDGAGLNGWAHHSALVGPDGRATIACVATGTPTGPFDLPLPDAPAPSGDAGPFEARALPAAAAQAAATGGLSVSERTGRALQQAAADARARGAREVWPDDLLMPLLAGTGDSDDGCWASLGLGAVTPLLVAVERPRGTSAEGDPPPSRSLRRLLGCAAEEAAHAGASTLTPMALLAGSLRETGSRASLLLGDAGVTLHRVRRAIGAAGDR